MSPGPTAVQKAALLADRDSHREWLAGNSLSEPEWSLPENPYTGLLLAALLDPAAQGTVLRALAAGDPRTAPSQAAVTAVRWPTRGPDLVVRQGTGRDAVATLIEHKRFDSPSHAPGYKSNPDAAWQTDQAYDASQAADPPLWLDGIDPGGTQHYIVLDAFGKTIEELYPGGSHNSHWTVTSYAQFGDTLRRAYAQGNLGLAPLIRALYAGSP